jgi:hypothetical protein
MKHPSIAGTVLLTGLFSCFAGNPRCAAQDFPSSPFSDGSPSLSRTGSVDRKILLVDIPISMRPAVLKFRFETTSPGASVSLCAGTPEQFEAKPARCNS